MRKIDSQLGYAAMSILALGGMMPPRVAMSEEETRAKAKCDRADLEAMTLEPLVNGKSYSARKRESPNWDSTAGCLIRPLAPKQEPHGRSEPRKKTSRKGRRS